MERILPALRSWPLHGVAASRRIEAAALAEQAAAKTEPLMQRAGDAVARLTLALAPHARRVWVAAGPGNNGGDGLEAALRLQQQGLAVQVSLTADVSRLPADAAASLQRARAVGVPIHADTAATPPPLDRQDIAIDALLGLGGRRPPDGPIATLIAGLNALPCLVLAVDIPSGLDADGGQPFGTHAVRADHTLALLTLKPGLFTGSGRDHAGTVWLDSLAVDGRSGSADGWLGGPPASGNTVRHPRRLHAQHKGSFGDVLVVAGAPGMVGAAVLAARAAHAAGAGRVWVAPLDPAAPRLDLVRPELMWRTGPDEVDEAALARSTVVCGCGGGEAVAAVLARLLANVPRLVLDADALNAIARDPALQAALRDRADRGQVSILTPHPLEVARLLACDTATVQSDRLKSAQALSERFGCVVVLKGSGSVIAAPGGPPWINTSGNAALATAGTGDVLAGWLAGAWSAAAGSGADDAALRTALEAARSAVWRHGDAADGAGLPVLRAADLIERMAGSARA